MRKKVDKSNERCPKPMVIATCENQRKQNHPTKQRKWLMNDPFALRAAPMSGPARDILPVTPDDAADLPGVAIGLFVETGGAISIETVAGGMRTMNVPDFSLLPLGVRRVFASGTTATGIHALVLA